MKAALNLNSTQILHKKSIQDREELDKRLRQDPFQKLWTDNYLINFEQGLLSNEKTRPIAFLEKHPEYRNIPVILIAAGPSLDKNIDAIKGYEDKCIIVCADVVLFKLLEHGIRPDFIVNVDPHESITRFWNFLDTSSLSLVCPTTTNPKSISAWKGRFFFYNQEDDPNSYKGETLKKLTKPTQGWGSIFNRFFIGATMTEFSTIFKPNPLILVGYDFAYTEGKAYCDGFLDIKVYHDENPEGTEEHKARLAAAINKMKADEVQKELEVYVSKDNPSVWTSRTLHMYKQTYVQYAKTLSFPIINATEGGILVEFPIAPLQETLQKHCITSLGTKDFFSMPKRKKRRKKR